MARLWLCFFTFPEIRSIHLILQLLVALTACICIWREIGWHGGIAVILAYLALSPYTVSLSMQYYPCFFLGFGGMIAVTLLYRRASKNIEWLFLILGILTAYLDFLTYPVVTLGLPLLIWVALNDSRKHIFRMMLRLGLVWCAGYAGMWCGKWMLCAIVNDAYAGVSVGEKLNNYLGDRENSIVNAVMMPLQAISKKRILLLALPSICLAVKNGIHFLRNHAALDKKAIYYVLIMLLPVAWNVVTKGHSVTHTFLSNRNLAVFFAAAFLLAGTAFTQKQSKENDHGTASRLQSGEN